MLGYSKAKMSSKYKLKSKVCCLFVVDLTTTTNCWFVLSPVGTKQIIPIGYQTPIDHRCAKCRVEIADIKYPFIKIGKRSLGRNFILLKLKKGRRNL